MPKSAVPSMAVSPPYLLQSKRRRSPWRARFFPFLLLLLAIAAFGYVWYVLEREFAHHIEEQFSLETRELSIRIQEHMTAYQQILRGGRGLFTASDNVTREEWRDYVKSLNLEMDYQGILGVGFAINLSPERLDAHIRTVRAERFPHYTVWPPGQRSSYSAIIYLEPFTGRNLRAFGYDMLSEAVRRTAMEKARDSGKSALSGKVRLVQETETDIQTGVLLYLPIYRNGAPSQTLSERRAALIGWVYSPFRMNDLMRGVLGRVSETTHLRIYDGEQETDEALLYDSHTGLTDILSLTARTPIEIAGHIWTLRYTALPGFVAEQKGHEPLRNTVVLGMIDLLLFVIVWLLSHSRQRAEDMAEQLTVSLRESENRYRLSALKHQLLFDSSRDALMLLAPPSWNFTRANPATLQLFGAASETEFTARGPWEVSPERQPDGRLSSEKAQEMIAAAMHNGSHFFEWQHRRLNGQVFSADVLLTRMEIGNEQFLQATVRNISERKRTETILAESEERFRNLAQAASDAIITIDDQDMIISWNPSSARTFGYTAAEMLGKPLTPIIPERYRALHQAGLARFRASGKSRLIGQTLELEGLRLDGTTFPIELALSTWQSNGRQYFTAIIRDISERKKTENLIRYQASYDPLTGLPNRRLFHDRLHAEITRAVRLQNVLALLFMDLDHFKEVNDMFGHAAGDALLCEAAQRMQSCVRESDIVARLAGDEFTVILTDLKDSQQAVLVAEKLIDHLSEAFDVIGHRANVSASIGIALCPADGCDRHTLIEKADKAMYRAKQAGRARACCFSDT